jgi:hypothetical protein
VGNDGPAGMIRVPVTLLLDLPMPPGTSFQQHAGHVRLAMTALPDHEPFPSSERRPPALRHGIEPKCESPSEAMLPLRLERMKLSSLDIA